MDCNERVTPGRAAHKGSKTCSDASHKKMEEQNIEKIASMFILTQRFQKTQISHLTEFFATNTNTAPVIPELFNLQDSEADAETGDPVEEYQEWFKVDDEGQVTICNEPAPGTIGVDNGATEPCPSKARTGNRIVKARFGQTCKGDCGLNLIGF